MLLRLQWLVVALVVVLWLAHAGTGLRPSAATDAAAFVEQQSHSWARRFTRDLALATGGGLLAALGIVLRRRRRRRPVRNEGDLLEALGEPLLAARPAREAALRELCRQLLEHWFTDGRALLPVVSAERGEGRTHLVASLAETFAQMDVRTLLIDADLRSPGQHREFRIENRRGLADLLADREVQPAVSGGSLAVLTAGVPTGEPLELLSRPRLREFLAAAGKRFRVVLIDTPAAAEGPDLQIFAALAGGALVVHKKEADRAGLLGLRKHLQAARSRTVSVVLSG
ncbi:MAG TPA: CpsD/CapB family tyrosine-protein kinase [Burkholderiales bacterium]